MGTMPTTILGGSTMAEATFTVDVVGLPEVEARHAALLSEIDALNARIANGRAAHNEDRAARDWLARECERLRRALELIALPGSTGVTLIAKDALASRSPDFFSGRDPVVWADDASPFTGVQVKALLDENQRFRDVLEKIEGGDGCYTPSYGDCCDMRCAQIARDALAGGGR